MSNQGILCTVEEINSLRDVYLFKYVNDMPHIKCLILDVHCSIMFKIF